MHDLSALESNESYENAEWEEEEELTESEELESAAELLAVGNEAELDQFLGKLIRKAARKVRKHVSSITGNSLGGVLKGLARQALPMVATAVGGPVGGILAKGGLAAAGKAFGLELEGLSEEDQELELARRYVRFANAASKRVLRQPVARDPRAQVRSAMGWAMRRHAPGLLRSPSSRRPRPSGDYPGRFAGSFPHYGGYPAGDPVALGSAVPPPLCPACAPCPTCPSCGAPTPPEPPAATTATPPAEAGQAAVASEFEDEYGYEFEDEHEHEHEHEHEYEYEYEGAPASAAGRWVRRGNRIILHGA